MSEVDRNPADGKIYFVDSDKARALGNATRQAHQILNILELIHGDLGLTPEQKEARQKRGREWKVWWDSLTDEERTRYQINTSDFSG